MRFAPERVTTPTPAVNAAPQSAPAASGRAQRVDGALKLRYAADAQGRTRLADLYQRAPCRVLFPQVEPDEPPQAVLLTTSGGLTSGDCLALDIAVDAGARATLTTQAAEKLYRAADTAEADTQIDIRLRLAAGAYAEWFAQETIVFDGARLRRQLTAELSGDARLLAVESLVFGRTAMRETLRSGRIHDGWHIRCDGRLVWADALHLDGDLAALRAKPYGYTSACGSATLVYAGPDAAAQLELARTRLAAASGIAAGATVVNGVLVLRVLADEATALRAAVIDVAAALRTAVAGLPARLPRVWHC